MHYNHLSGDPKPRPDDVAVTNAIIQAGRSFDIEELDHLAIEDCSFVSLRELGLGF